MLFVTKYKCDKINYKLAATSLCTVLTYTCIFSPMLELLLPYKIAYTEILDTKNTCH